jgi:sugar diacid utilization regulator
MNWEQIKSKLEPIIKAPFIMRNLPITEWNKLAKAQSDAPKICKRVLFQGQLYFLLDLQASVALILVVEETALTEAEKLLIELIIDAYRFPDKTRAAGHVSDEEKTAHLVKEWVDRQLALNVKDAPLPEQLASKLSLMAAQIPLLLYGGYADSNHMNYKELKKLLESFFEADLIIIPLLEKEWLILGSDSLLTASKGEDKESIEEALTSICSGLYEMLANEWIGECQLSIHYPLALPAKSLLHAIVDMRETMRLGKTFYPGADIYLPWQMRLETLLNLLSETEQLRFVGQVLKRSEQLPDTEMYLTLEQFFNDDCNVSETAKTLYIHRNTLLYRLDKFKQETGLDVRNFSDAVLVKVALLLYKVTKRR